MLLAVHIPQGLGTQTPLDPRHRIVVESALLDLRVTGHAERYDQGPFPSTRRRVKLVPTQAHDDVNLVGWRLGIVEGWQGWKYASLGDPTELFLHLRGVGCIAASSGLRSGTYNRPFTAQPKHRDTFQGVVPSGDRRGERGNTRAACLQRHGGLTVALRHVVDGLRRSPGAGLLVGCGCRACQLDREVAVPGPPTRDRREPGYAHVCLVLPPRGHQILETDPLDVVPDLGTTWFLRRRVLPDMLRWQLGMMVLLLRILAGGSLRTSTGTRSASERFL